MPEEIFEEISKTESTLLYKVDGVDFKTFGVYVTASSGIQDTPTMKEPQTVDWSGSHGKVVDLENPRYNEREIVLDCFLKASGKPDFFAKVRTFLQAFQKSGLRKLQLTIASEPLLYMVYQSDSVEIDKKWKQSEMFGTFKLKLIEP